MEGRSGPETQRKPSSPSKDSKDRLIDDILASVKAGGPSTVKKQSAPGPATAPSGAGHSQGSRTEPTVGIGKADEVEFVEDEVEFRDDDIEFENVPEHGPGPMPAHMAGHSLLNGRGHQMRPGIANGRGMVNGSGLINGNGFVNGPSIHEIRGLVNGNGLVNGLNRNSLFASSYYRRRSKARTKLVSFTILAAMLMLLTPLAAILTFPPATRLEVDGDLSEWADMAIYSDGSNSTVPSRDLDIVSYSVAEGDGRLFFYLRCARNMLAGRSSTDGVDTVNIYIDTDNDPGTGYSVWELGADRRLEMYGWGGLVRGSSIYDFMDNRSASDWNGWRAAGPLRAAVSGSELEACAHIADLGRNDTRSYRVLFQTIDSATGHGDFSRARIGTAPGALLVAQEPAGPPVIEANQSRVAMTRLRLDAMARDITIGAITVTRLGDATDTDTALISLEAGGKSIASGYFTGQTGKLLLRFERAVSMSAGLELELRVNTPVAPTPNRTFGLLIVGSGDIATARGTVTVCGGAELSYLVSAPSLITVDGAFADWAAVQFNNDSRGDAERPDTDITGYRAAKDPEKASFFVQVAGTIMLGTQSPMARILRPRPAPPGPPGPDPGPVEPLPAQTGDDMVDILIDTDNNPLTGCPVNGLDLGAEFALSISGKGGGIAERKILSWMPAQAVWAVRGTCDAACDRSRMELQAPLAELGLIPNSTFGAYFITSDWRNEGDITDSRLVIADPLQLTGAGEIYHSADGSNWTFETDIGSKTFVDLSVDSSGYAYALATDGTVYRSTGDWACWTIAINATVNTDFVSLVCDGGSPQSFFALASDGDVYRTSGTEWGSAVGDIGTSTDFVDMCIVNGTGAGATLYAIRSATNDKVKTSSDGGASWGKIGKNIGDDGNGETNVAIAVGPAWGRSNIFILQSDGDLRNDTDGTTASPWGKLENSSAAGTYVDLVYGQGGILWAVTSDGQAYKFTPGGSPGQGSWSTMGTSGVSGVVAIATGEIPEFRDIVIPLAGMVLAYVFIRRRRNYRQ